MKIIVVVLQTDGVDDERRATDFVAELERRFGKVRRRSGSVRRCQTVDASPAAGESSARVA